MRKVAVLGGAGYVGAVLVPKLLDAGYEVKVIDLYIYGEDVIAPHPNLTQVIGDVRNTDMLRKEVVGIDSIIHLACISNDPSCDLDPQLAKSINYDAFVNLMPICREVGIKQFIFASSSSVYGIKDVPNVTEELSLDPLTDYSKYKARCEEVLLRESNNFLTTIIRPSTICGYSPRQRLDLTVNIFTNQAINRREVTVFGGNQMRPSLHIDDMTDLYVKLLSHSYDIHRKIYNFGCENFTVMDIAKRVIKLIDKTIPLTVTETNDNRSYHISSDKIKNELGIEPIHTIEEAILDLKRAFELRKLIDPLNNSIYYNIKRMQEIKLI